MAGEPVEEDTIYQIKITLDGIKPPIWRRVQVPALLTLGGLHQVIQTAMGWDDYHLHDFTVGRQRYGIIDADDGFFPIGFSDDIRAQIADKLGVDIDAVMGGLPEAGPGNLIDEEDVTLAQVAPGEKTKIKYQYDFGDGWEHTIVIEKVLKADPDRTYPFCMDGARACPPEDCGGIWGYGNLLEAIADPNHEEHGELLEWVGGEFDPEEFDPDEVNTLFEEFLDLDAETAEQLEALSQKLDELPELVEEIQEIKDGYALRFPNQLDIYMSVSLMIPVLITQGLTLRAVIEVDPPDEGPIWLRLTRDKGAIRTVLEAMGFEVE